MHQCGSIYPPGGSCRRSRSNLREEIPGSSNIHSTHVTTFLSPSCRVDLSHRSSGEGGSHAKTEAFAKQGRAHTTLKRGKLLPRRLNQPASHSYYFFVSPPLPAGRFGHPERNPLRGAAEGSVASYSLRETTPAFNGTDHQPPTTGHRLPPAAPAKLRDILPQRYTHSTPISTFSAFSQAISKNPVFPTGNRPPTTDHWPPSTGHRLLTTGHYLPPIYRPSTLYLPFSSFHLPSPPPNPPRAPPAPPCSDTPTSPR